VVVCLAGGDAVRIRPAELIPYAVRASLASPVREAFTFLEVLRVCRLAPIEFRDTIFIQ
jgi:hypothetical protein